MYPIEKMEKLLEINIYIYINKNYGTLYEMYRIPNNLDQDKARQVL